MHPCKLFFSDYMLMTSKCMFSNHDLVFDLSPWLQMQTKHQSQECIVLLADRDLIVALLCSTRMHSRKSTTEQEPTQQSL